jgi:hypothetical protein
MKRSLFLAALFAAALPLGAQDPAQPGAGQPGQPGTPASNGTNTVIPMFRATLPGGTYQVAVRSIVAVASHEYLVDGVARVTEVNVDTNGSMLARFYFLEPASTSGPAGLGAATIGTVTKMATEAADKAVGEAWRKVVKNYPTTTHARTVEYRLSSKDDLQKIFSAADEAFRLQRNRSVSIGE